MVSCCISLPFGRLSTTRGKITYVLLTRAPLYRGLLPFSCDLHVLSAPLTFVLSQDQTLQLDLESSVPRASRETYQRERLFVRVASLSSSILSARLLSLSRRRANMAPRLSSQSSSFPRKD